MYLRAVAPPFIFNGDLVRNIRSSDMIKSKVKNRIEGFKFKRGDYVLFNKLIKEVQEYIRDYEEKGLKSPEETMMDYVQKYKKDSFNNKNNSVVCFSANLAMGLLWKEVDCLCELVNKGSKMGTNDYGKSNKHMYLRAVAPPFIFNADLQQ